MATLVFMGFESLSHHFLPATDVPHRADYPALKVYVQALPVAAHLIVALGWVIGSLFCGFIIRIIAKSPDKTPAYIAGLFLTTAGIVDVSMLPYPLWYIITGIVVFIPMTLLGHIIGRR